MKEDIENLKSMHNPHTKEKSFPCDMCNYACQTADILREHKQSLHEGTSEKHSLSQELLFHCDFCAYSSTSQKGVNIHKGAKHKTEKMNTTSSINISSAPRTTNISLANLKDPVPCFRHEEGCTKIVEEYFDTYTAFCNECIIFMNEKQKTSPFSPNLCPCCHNEANSEENFSLCSDCLEYLLENGFVESDWGSWVLDRDSKKILCQQLELR